MSRNPRKTDNALEVYSGSILRDISRLIEAARSSAARSINSFMTAAYWLIGRHIVEFEQQGEKGWNKISDSVWQFANPALEVLPHRSGALLPTALVRICSAAFGEKRAGPQIL